MPTQDNHVLPSGARSSTASEQSGQSDQCNNRPTNQPAKPGLDKSADNADGKLDENEHLQNDISQAGSLELGKHRQQDAPVSTDPEKHVSPHTQSKEFHFPKSN